MIHDINYSGSSISARCSGKIWCWYQIIGVVAGFIGLRLYEHLLRRREPEKAG
jgi:hypothetical protein